MTQNKKDTVNSLKAKGELFMSIAKAQEDDKDESIECVNECLEVMRNYINHPRFLKPLGSNHFGMRLNDEICLVAREEELESGKTTFVDVYELKGKTNKKLSAADIVEQYGSDEFGKLIENVMGEVINHLIKITSKHARQNQPPLDSSLRPSL